MLLYGRINGLSDIRSQWHEIEDEIADRIGLHSMAGREYDPDKELYESL